MKHFFLWLLCFSTLISLCGCSAKVKTSSVTCGINFIAEVEYGEEILQYNVKISKNSDCETEILDNGEPTGFKTIITGNNVTLISENLEYKTTLSSLPDNLFVDLFATCFKDAATKEVKEVNHQLYTEGKTHKYSYKIYLGESGLPIKLKEKNFQVTAIIKNVTILK